jgi:Family of unknown function (DUF6069)
VATDRWPTRGSVVAGTVPAMTSTTAQPVSRSLLRHRATTVLGAVGAGAAAWAVLTGLGGVDLAAGSPPVAVGLAQVVLTAAVAGGAGWALLAALERWTSAPRRTWRIAAVIALVLSLAGPLTMAAGIAAFGGLVTLHVVVGAALIVGFGARC